MWLVDDRNPRAIALDSALRKAGADVHTADAVVVVIGGDGFMLSSMHQHGSDRTYVGLNAGTVGFLLNDVLDVEATVAALREERWGTMSFPTLALTATTTDGHVRSARAINDVTVERSTGQMAHLRIVVDGVEVVRRLACDGIVIATSLGSTAYSFSAGGTACHPLVRATHLTPICPHSPRLAPLTLPDSCVVEVEAVDPDRRPVRAFADGTEQGGVSRLEVRRAREEVQIGFLDGHELTRTLVQKILQA